MGQNVFSGCTNLTTVVLPDDAIIIDSSMFGNNTSLTNVNIPKSLKRINSSAFVNTAINNIELPNVKDVDDFVAALKDLPRMATSQSTSRE